MMDTCALCAHDDKGFDESPCSECFDFSKWEEKTEVKQEAYHDAD